MFDEMQVHSGSQREVRSVVTQLLCNDYSGTSDVVRVSGGCVKE